MSQLISTFQNEKKQKLAIHEDLVLRRHFLTLLRSVVEAEIFTKNADSSSLHYYQAAIAAEIQRRLAA